MTKRGEIKNTDKLQFEKTIIAGVEIKRCRKTTHSYKMHLHNELSIGYIEEGSTCVTLGDKEYAFKSGDAMIIPPLMSHMCCPDDIEKWQTVIFYIDKMYYEVATDFDEPFKLSKENTEKLLEMIDAIEESDDALYIENLLVEVLLNCAQEIHKKGELEETEDTRLACEVEEYIKENFLESISLSELEKRFSTNKFTIIRNFRKKYNTTPMAFQLQLKMAEAKDMLSEEWGVLDVCDKLKFYDQAHFIKEFKKANGITPEAYRNSILKN
ncbi:MAG: AraC family transcriptional regulator [Eubacteriales bacterium]